MIFIQQKGKYEADNKRLLMVYKSAMAAYKLTDEYRTHGRAGRVDPAAQGQAIKAREETQGG